MAAMGSTARVSHVLCARTCRFLSGRTASSSSSPISPFRGARAAAAADPKIGRRGWQWRAVRARLDVAVRPDTYREELDVKIERARSHFAAAPAPAPAPSDPDPKPLEPIELPPTEVHESARANFRMRAEFRVWHDGDRSYLAMFDSDDPKTPIEVPAFPMGSERINDLMPRFLEEIGKSEVIRRKLFQVNFLTTRKGDALVSMLYHKPVKTDGWAEAAEEMRQRLGVSIIGRSRKQKVVLGNDYVMEEIEVDGRTLTYKQLEGGFTQPNAGISAKMLEWAKSAAVSDKSAAVSDCAGGGDQGADIDTTRDSTTRRRDDDFLELYCGNGNFTIAMAPMFRKVLATEVSKVSVAAAKHNAELNDADNVAFARLSSEELTLALDQGKEFMRLEDVPPLESYDLKTVLVDPPRAGMGPEVAKFVSRFERIVYVSCNPATLADDVRMLHDTHVVKRFAAFDQFPYTPHLECGALLVAKER